MVATSNARFQPLPEAEATQERRLGEDAILALN